jgi:hypothetical protein
MHALSIGDDATPRGRGSIRGRIVRVLDHRVGFSFGFVLTAHEYSLQRRYQIVVPIVDRVVEGEDGLEELALTPWDVVPERQSWFANLPFAEPMIDTARLLSLTEEWRKSRDPRRWLHKQIEMTSGMIDETTLAEIEAKIVERLLR